MFYNNIMENLPKRKKNRLKNYDYSSPRAYFVTICTKNKISLFWKNVGAIINRPQEVVLSNYGKIVERSIQKITQHYSVVLIDHYVIMPNHVHLLLQIKESGRLIIAPTISTVIQQFKRDVSIQIKQSIWQKSFHDHIVREIRDYEEIWNYIETNPIKWQTDELYRGGK